MLEVKRAGCFETPLSGGANFRHRRTQSDVHRWISSQPRHRGHRRSENQLSPQCSNFNHSQNSFPHCVIPWSLKFVVSHVSFMYLSPFDQSWHAVGVKNTKLKDRNHSSLRNWLSPSSLMQPFNNYNLFVSTISKTSFSISGTWAKAVVLTLASVR